jgi:hypothetical protein
MKKLLIFTLVLVMLLSTFTVFAYAEENDEHDHSDIYSSIEHRYGHSISFEDGLSYPFGYYGYPYNKIDEKLFHTFGKQYVNRPDGTNLLYIIEDEIADFDMLHWNEMKDENLYHPIEINIDGKVRTIYINKDISDEQIEILKRNDAESTTSNNDVLDVITITLLAVYGIVLTIHIIKSKPVIIENKKKNK